MTTQDEKDTVFRREIVDRDLKFRCHDCAHADKSRDKCSMGYPSDVLYSQTVRIKSPDGQYIFCKYFELEGS